MSGLFTFNMSGFDCGEIKPVDAALFDQFSQPHLMTSHYGLSGLFLERTVDMSSMSGLSNISDHQSALQTSLQSTQHNYCPDCKVPMELSGSEYQCHACGLTQKNELECNNGNSSIKDHDDTVSSSIRITTGTNRGRFYNVQGDYTKTQRKAILTQLLQHQSRYTGPAFPLNVLNATATQYNRIQKMITEDDLDENGKVRGQKKFVRRGSIKDEILAALLYFECIRENVVRKKKDIAVFMGLVTNGFSRGENILRNLEAEGKIELPDDNEPVSGYVDRYLEALNIDKPEYGQFIIALVEDSERRKIGVGSQISSKIVGAIWILINKCRLNITAQALEKATDNTKKNTFTKFSNIVLDNIRTFAPIFAMYGIPQ